MAAHLTRTQDMSVAPPAAAGSALIPLGIRVASLVIFCLLRLMTIAAATTPRIL
ncbi:MAG: hypothetical protein F2809_08170, partial [Actinobacteria bacterium]|nr:hypothetical protein [Actinomycetota bacterium]